ncbi:MAG: hypothetical protein HY350_05085, partial [Candidatus Omnitrophica bacterium]|nr:hypothetical protein [Candidatus Omnitrophota bacterium]
LIISSFSSAAGDITAGWFIRFLSPHFVYLKVISFWIFQLSMLLIIILSFISLNNKGCASEDNEKS